MVASLFAIAVIAIVVSPRKWQPNLCAAILYLAAGLVAAHQQNVVSAMIGAIGSGVFVFFAGTYRVESLLKNINL